MKFVWMLMLMIYGVRFCSAWPKTHYHVFMVEEVPCTRLCQTKMILTVNGLYPGPTLYVHQGDTAFVTVINRSRKNITIHWHGVKQPRNPWSDGPAYITQCPIRPGGEFTYTVIFSTEVGTVWWHAHNDFDRATVHGAIVVYPAAGRAGYPFPTPYQEHVIILGEWWKEDVDVVMHRALATGGDFNASDAYTINGQPGDFYPCSALETFRLQVEPGKTYLLRLVNADMSDGLFFAIAGHRLTVVGSDGAYLKPFPTDYLLIFPGETIDVLLTADASPAHCYYMAARGFFYLPTTVVDNTTTTAILEYTTTPSNHTPPLLPTLPYYNDTAAATSFLFSLRGTPTGNPAYQPAAVTDITERILMTIAVNAQPCELPPPIACQGPNGTRLAASLNNLSFVDPAVDILTAYYYNIPWVFGTGFPARPPHSFNLTADEQPRSVLAARRATEVGVVELGVGVEVVFQGTSILGGDAHPMHLHGQSFYVVGSGFGNFDADKDVKRFNLVDPPLKNTFGVPRDGWVAVRFVAKNPGVWFLHCHLERHMIWGMDMVFITRDGPGPMDKMLPPPPHMPPCLGWPIARPRNTVQI